MDEKTALRIAQEVLEEASEGEDTGQLNLPDERQRERSLRRIRELIEELEERYPTDPVTGRARRRGRSKR